MTSYLSTNTKNELLQFKNKLKEKPLFLKIRNSRLSPELDKFLKEIQIILDIDIQCYSFGRYYFIPCDTTKKAADLSNLFKSICSEIINPINEKLELSDVIYNPCYLMIGYNEEKPDLNNLDKIVDYYNNINALHYSLNKLSENDLILMCTNYICRELSLEKEIVSNLIKEAVTISKHCYYHKSYPTSNQSLDCLIKNNFESNSLEDLMGMINSISYKYIINFKVKNNIKEFLPVYNLVGEPPEFALTNNGTSFDIASFINRVFKPYYQALNWNELINYCDNKYDKEMIQNYLNELNSNTNDLNI